MDFSELRNLKTGQRLRVSFEGEFQQVANQTLIIRRNQATDHWITVSEGLTVEVIEPEYENNGVYLDADGSIWVFDASYFDNKAWFAPGDDTPYGFESPVRPLVRLVPEGSNA